MTYCFFEEVFDSSFNFLEIKFLFCKTIIERRLETEKVYKKWMKKATVAYTVHSYIWHGAWNEIASDIKRRYFQERYCVQHADKVFVLNENTKHNLLTHVGVAADRVRLVDNGVNTDVYYPVSDAEKESIKTKLKVSGKKVFVKVENR